MENNLKKKNTEFKRLLFFFYLCMLYERIIQLSQDLHTLLCVEKNN